MHRKPHDFSQDLLRKSDDEKPNDNKEVVSYSGPTVDVSVMTMSDGQGGIWPSDDGFYLFRNLASITNALNPVVKGSTKAAMTLADTGGTRGVGTAYTRVNPENADQVGSDTWRVDHPRPETVKAVEAYLSFFKGKQIPNKEKKKPHHF